jgi:predicted ATPase
MQLRQLDIQNFRAIREQSLLFADAMGRVRPITVLAGPNGCGKTTVLYAIYRALSGAMGYYSDDVPEAHDEEIYREGGAGGWSFQPNRVSVRLVLEYPNEEREAAQPLMDRTRILQRPRQDGSLLQLPKLPDGQLVVTWGYPPEQRSDGSFMPLAFVHADLFGSATWLSLPKLAIKGWRHRPRLVELDILNKIGILRMFAQNRGKRWIAAEEAEAFPADTADESETSEPTPRSRRRNLSVSEILKVLGDAANGRRPNRTQDEDNIEQKLRDSFTRICNPKRYIGYVYYDPSDMTGTPLLEDGDRQYPLSMAATGEQVILDYLTQFVYPRPVNNSLILIDEPELHLHPRWIRQLYRALPQLGRGNQFIMTTHSPELRQLAAEDNALVDMGNLSEPSVSVSSV